MDAVIKPSKAEGRAFAPPSKSMAHRYIICAALAEGPSLISNVAPSQDILATLDCIRTLGAGALLEEGSVRIEGIGGKGIPKPYGDPTAGLKSETLSCDISEANLRPIFNCRESGSTLRFFLPISWALDAKGIFRGSETLMNRPLSVYEDLAKVSGLGLEKEQSEIITEGKLKSGTYEFAGNISSQFVTGLLFALAMLKGDSRIKLIPPVESRSYINLTLQALGDFGINIIWEDENTLYIPGGQVFKSGSFSVEGDWSNGAFLSVFNVLGGKVEVEGLRADSLQGDRVCLEHFKSLNEGFAHIDISDCPDLGPVLMAAAAALNGAEFTGTERLALKESNRGLVMCRELKKFGVESRMESNRITILKSQLKTPSEPILGHNDHRIVMSMATLLSLTGGTIKGAQAVNKSYPDYFEIIKKLGIEVELNGMD